ncbi:hypothetical protein [Halomarina pelagica]|uniref:hypothetical protein n=1 Tax=Halomarina pelagica TaxID=2961599 RepID=UPI0020C2E55F|nr:hypothetical protein [Halomarina sp. BND7]
MGLKRVGTSLFGFGLFLGSVVAVVFGIGSARTTAACRPGVDPQYSIARFDLVPVSLLRETPLSGLVRPEIVVSNGCTSYTVSVLVQWAAVFVVLGLVVGGIGVFRSRP